MNIITKNGHDYTLSNNLTNRSVLLSQLLLYPDDSTALPIPFNLKTIEIAEQFAEKDSITKEIPYNQENIYSLEYYKPVDIKNIFIKNEMMKILEQISIEELSELINLANYLNYNILLECCCSRLANMLNGVSPHDISAEDIIWS